MASIFVAEVISDSPAYGKDAKSRLSSIASIATGAGSIPIGTIEWRASGDPTLPPATGFAAPLTPWHTTIAAEGEYVLIISSPAPGNTDDDNQESFYYLGPINIDGAKNYNGAEGIYNQGTTTASPTLPVIPNISRKSVPPVQPLLGDTIFQDRYGSVIRMSSTQAGNALPSLNISSGAQMPFSKPGTPTTKFSPAYTPGAAGNPIMMLTVGLPAPTGATGRLGGIAGVATAAEAPQKDRSFLYLTSDQSINFGLPRKGFKNGEKNQPCGTKTNFPKEMVDYGRCTKPTKGKYDNANVTNPSTGQQKFAKVAAFPLNPKSPSTAQIIMGSDRIVISAKRDNVLIAGNLDVKIGTENWRFEVDSSMDLINELIKQTMATNQHIQELAAILWESLAVMQVMQFPTGVGPTGPCLEVFEKQIKAIQKKINNKDGVGDFALEEKNKKSLTAGPAFRIQNLDTLLAEWQKMRRSEADKSANDEQQEEALNASLDAAGF